MRFFTLRCADGMLAASIALLAATVAAQNCQTGFTLCQPSGATATTIPSTGPELAGLYNDLLASVKDVKAAKRSEEPDGRGLVARDTPAFCCNEGTSCLNLQGFNVPMCYDRFTTNFKLIDGASGTIDSGAFTCADGGTANLQQGSFTGADKNSGNMYTGTAAAESPTDTAAIPTPFTGTGVGSAIPLSALGVVETLTITLPGTTIPGTTVTPETAPSTVAGTTRAATTVAPQTTIITTNVPTAGAVATSATSKADAAGKASFGDGAMGAALAGILAGAMLL